MTFALSATIAAAVYAVGFFHGAYRTWKLLKRVGDDASFTASREMLMFWTLVALIAMYNRYVEVACTWLPFYWGSSRSYSSISSPIPRSAALRSPLSLSRRTVHHAETKCVLLLLVFVPRLHGAKWLFQIAVDPLIEARVKEYVPRVQRAIARCANRAVHGALVDDVIGEASDAQLSELKSTMEDVLLAVRDRTVELVPQQPKPKSKLKPPCVLSPPPLPRVREPRPMLGGAEGEVEEVNDAPPPPARRSTSEGGGAGGAAAQHAQTPPLARSTAALRAAAAVEDERRAASEPRQRRG